MALREGYNQMLRDNPVGNWFDSPPVGGLPQPQGGGGQIPEGGHFGGGHVPKPDSGFVPPFEQPLPPSPPGQSEPMWRRPSEVGQ